MQEDSPETQRPETSHVTVEIDIAAGERVEIVVENQPGTGELKVFRSDQPGIEKTFPSLVSVKPELKEFWGNPFTAIKKHTKSWWEHAKQPVTLRPQILFAVGVILYLVVHFWGLTKFPIYFSCDEAVNPVLASNLVRDDLKSYDGELLPTFFRNGGQYCISTSVYAQLPVVLLFGKSVFATRAAFALISTLTAFWVGFALRDIFKNRLWWLAPYVLTIIPAWFLLSRAAFEYSLQVTFFSGFLYYYLCYRKTDPRAIYPAIVCGALSFYSYTPGQIIMVVAGVLMLLTDLPYHWQQRKTIWKAAILLLLVALPLVRFISVHPDQYIDRLLMYKSYLVSDLTPWQKLLQYMRNYAAGLNPLYWFLPNQMDNPRYVMQGYAHLTWWMLPFVLVGLGIAIRFIRKAEMRILLIALLAAPTGAAMIGLTVHRALAIMVPIVLLAFIPFQYIYSWLCKKRNIREGMVSFFLAVAFTTGAIIMTVDAIRNGPTWFDNYGISGMQYGAQQVYQAAEKYQAMYPDKTIFITPNWTFQSEVVREFFTQNSKVKMGGVDSVLEQFDPDLNKKVFVLLPDELQKVRDSGLFSQVIEDLEIPYPNGNQGFTFIRLQYRDDIENIYNEKRQELTKPVEGSVVWHGVPATVRYSALDMGPIENIFDGDKSTLIKSKGINPLELAFEFSQPVQASNLIFSVGSEQVKFTVDIQQEIGDTVIEYVQEAGEVEGYKDVTLDLGKKMEIRVLKIQIQDTLSTETMPVHLWELQILP
ncbi:MAG: hypothetical protein ABFD58_06650 [Anaerolineaceae bacterium]